MSSSKRLSGFHSSRKAPSLRRTRKSGVCRALVERPDGPGYASSSWQGARHLPYTIVLALSQAGSQMQLLPFPGLPFAQARHLPYTIVLALSQAGSQMQLLPFPGLPFAQARHLPYAMGPEILYYLEDQGPGCLQFCESEDG